jgi:polysaccharide biosynthesis protein VpsQ
MTLILRRVILNTLPLLYMGLIWIQSGYFNPELVGNISVHIHKNLILLIGVFLELAHFFEFGFLYLFIVLAFLSWGELTKGKEYIAIMISVFYGVGDEIHQYFVPFRSASLGDLLKNTIGITVFWWIIHLSYYEISNSKLACQLKKILPKSFER